MLYNNNYLKFIYIKVVKSMSIIKINNLNFNYDNKILFNNLNLEIKENTWNSLIGNNGSGKTTLLKLILGLIESKGITIDNIELNTENKYEIRKKIGCVFEIPDNNLICETVKEELSFPLNNIGLNEQEVETRIDNITKLFNFKKKESDINSLNLDEKQTLSVMSALITNPKIIILDEAFTYMSKSQSIKILNILKNLNITVISVTHDVEELLYSDNIIIIKDGKIIANEKKETIFEKQLLNDYPFIVDLSLKLKYYELVDNISYTYKDLVNEIWK